jgi:hypothetical protein
MRLTYVGNFKPPHSTENHVAATFRDLGWDVTWAQEDAVASPNGWATVRSAALDSDLLLYTRTWGLPPVEAQRLWQELAAARVPTASLHLDLFIGLERERLVSEGDPLFTTSLVCTADGDHDAEWKRYGVRHHWLRPGVLRAECQPGALDGRWAGTEVAFVGSSRQYHGEWPYRRRLLAELQARFGDGFQAIPRAGQPAVRGQALNDLYASIPVLVGDSLCLERREARYWSDRVYETLGRGGFLVMPRIDALVDELEGCASVAWYEWDDWSGLEEIVRHWLARFRRDPEERERLVAAGSAFIRDRCTYHNRVGEMLDRLRLTVRA